MKKIFSISTRPACLFSRLVLWVTLSFTAFAGKAQNARQMTDSGFNKMTIIRVYPDYHKDYAEVIFGESARFYQLPKNTAGYELQLKLLQAAYKKRKAVWIKTTLANGIIIGEIRDCKQ